MYFKVIDAPYDNGKFIINGSDKFYNLIGYTDGSYNIYQARAYGLMYGDFLRMVRDNYGAVLKGKGHKYPTYYFLDENQAKIFCKELNSQFSRFLLSFS